MSNFRVSTPFSQKDSLHPNGHQGVDFAGKTSGSALGKEIPSLSDGVVKQVFINNKTAGHGVVIQGSDGREYRYIHMKDKPTLKVGQKVTVGQNLGYIGSTGRSTGPHLDLKIKDKNGKYVDPLSIINSMSKNTKGTTTQAKSNPSNVNNWKTQKEAKKSPGYSSYKSHLVLAVKNGKIPDSWVIALTELIGRESNWNATVKNKKSSAYGYGQFLSSTRKQYEKKMGLSYDNPYNQILMTAEYVKDRYGTPEKALAFWDKNGWY